MNHIVDTYIVYASTLEKVIFFWNHMLLSKLTLVLLIIELDSESYSIDTFLSEINIST